MPPGAAPMQGPFPGPRRKKGRTAAVIAVLLVVVLAATGGTFWFLHSRGDDNPWIGSWSSTWAGGTRKLWSVEARRVWISQDGRWMVAARASGSRSSEVSYEAYRLEGEKLGEPISMDTDETFSFSEVEEVVFLADGRAVIGDETCQLASGKCQEAPWDTNKFGIVLEFPNKNLLAYDSSCFLHSTTSSTTSSCRFFLLAPNGQEISSLKGRYSDIQAPMTWNHGPGDRFIAIAADTIDIVDANDGHVVAHLDASEGLTHAASDGIVVDNNNKLTAYTWNGDEMWQERHGDDNLLSVWRVESVAELHSFLKEDLPELSPDDSYYALDKDSRYTLRNGRVTSLVTGQTIKISSSYEYIFPFAGGQGIAATTLTSEKPKISFWETSGGSEVDVVKGMSWVFGSQRLLVEEEGTGKNSTYTVYAPK